MFLRFNKDAFYRNADVEGTGGGEGGENTDPQDVADKAPADDVEAKIAAAVAAALEKETAGLKKKNAELIGKEKALKSELEGLKSKPALTDEEYSKFREMQSRMEHDELLKALAEGKSEEVIDKVTKKTRMDYEAKLAAAAEDRARVAGEAQAAKEQLANYVVNLEITKAAAGAVKPAYTDLVTKLISDSVKLVDGAARVVDANGDVQMSTKGQPLTVAEHIETLRGVYADLFLASAGGGAGGSAPKTQRAGGKLTPEQAEGLSMDEYERFRKEGRI